MLLILRFSRWFWGGKGSWVDGSDGGCVSSSHHNIDCSHHALTVRYRYCIHVRGTNALTSSRSPGPSPRVGRGLGTRLELIHKQSADGAIKNIDQSDGMSRLQLLLFLSALPLALSVSSLSVPFRGQKTFYRRSSVGDDAGSPVYLTPYIKAGQIDQGSINTVTPDCSFSCLSTTVEPLYKDTPEWCRGHLP